MKTASFISFLGAALALLPAVRGELPVAALSATPADALASTVRPLARDEFLGRLSRDLATHFNLEGDLELDFIRGWTPPAKVAANWNVEVTDYPNVPSSAMMVRCRITADAQVVGETSFMLRASLWRDAWVTRFPLTTGAGFDPSMLDTRRVDMFRDRDAVPVTVGDHSYVFSSSIPAGRLLTWRDIARRPLVKKGELVEVSAVAGVLTVTMKGVAMENGGRGDTVTVRNPDSRRDFSAMVVDENRVEVRF